MAYTYSTANNDDSIGKLCLVLILLTLSSCSSTLLICWCIRSSHRNRVNPRIQPTGNNLHEMTPEDRYGPVLHCPIVIEVRPADADEDTPGTPTTFYTSYRA